MIGGCYWRCGVGYATAGAGCCVDAGEEGDGVADAGVEAPWWESCC